MAIARTSPHVEVRDLFERFIPDEERVKRLGDVIDRASILALPGDAVRGRAVFTTNRPPLCKTCHKVGDVGETVGPGPDQDRGQVQQGRLARTDPRAFEDDRPGLHDLPAARPRTAGSSRAWSWRRRTTAVVLKDAQGKTVRLPNAEVERMVPQSRSLMPELLLRDLTAQQVADLLEFLAGLR